jgi:hypothetical protein
VIFVVGWDRSGDCAEVFDGWAAWQAGEPLAKADTVRGGLFQVRRAADAIGADNGGAVEVWAAGCRLEDGILTFF